MPSLRRTGGGLTRLVALAILIAVSASPTLAAPATGVDLVYSQRIAGAAAHAIAERLVDCYMSDDTETRIYIGGLTR